MFREIRAARGWVTFMAVVYVAGALFGAASAGLAGATAQLDPLASLTASTALLGLIPGIALRRYSNALANAEQPAKLAAAQLAFWKLYVLGLALTTASGLLGVAASWFVVQRP